MRPALDVHQDEVERALQSLGWALRAMRETEAPASLDARLERLRGLRACTVALTVAIDRLLIAVTERQEER